MHSIHPSFLLFPCFRGALLSMFVKAWSSSSALKINKNTRFNVFPRTQNAGWLVVVLTVAVFFDDGWKWCPSYRVEVLCWLLVVMVMLLLGNFVFVTYFVVIIKIIIIKGETFSQEVGSNLNNLRILSRKMMLYRWVLDQFLYVVRVARKRESENNERQVIASPQSMFLYLRHSKINGSDKKEFAYTSSFPQGQ